MSGPAANEQAALRQDSEFDFWDFVSCAVCHLPFSPPDRGPPPVPFWVTECGHVLCNSHLNPDQSCTKCGDQAIQLAPLQRNIDPPMSDWFRSLSYAADSVSNAIRFQQESLAALVRHYRNQCLQLSSTCDRLRNERRSLRKENEALHRELHLCRSRGVVTEQSRESSAHLNHNGKRPMDDLRGLSRNSNVKTNSSPRSIPTPLGPLRLTLLPGEHPSFSKQGSAGQDPVNTVDRPGSSRFTEQYVFHGDDNPRARAHQPIGETDDQRSTSLRQSRPFDVNHRMMVPRPPPDQGKCSKPAISQQIGKRMENSTSYDLGPQGITKPYENMGPPPTPQRPFSAALRTPSRIPDLLMQDTIHHPSSTLQSNSSRFIPSSSHGRPFPGSSSAVTSTAGAGNAGKAFGGNRMPFLPQSSNGFG